MTMYLILLLTAAAIQLAASGCPSGYSYGTQSKSCFAAVKANTTSRAEAASNCASRGGHLVYLDSAVKQTEVTNYFTTTFPSSVSGPVQTIWIGGCRNVGGKFDWSDKCAQGGAPADALKFPVSYTNWQTGEPNNSGNLEWCVNAYSGSLKLSWNDVSCNKPGLAYYICEADPLPDCPTAINVCDSNPCANGGGCVKTGSTTFTCVCAAGWTGIKCETEFNPCADKPCVNNGTCTKTGPVSHSCTCAAGWTGENCGFVAPPPPPTACDVPVPPRYNGILVQQHYYKEGSTYFARPWAEYAAGFGTHDGNYWIGNDALNRLTAGGAYKLRIDVLSRETNCTWYYAIYNKFTVGAAASKYVLSAGGYSGNLGDVLTYADESLPWWVSDGMKFTTIDQDNDDNNFPVYNNCATCTNGNTCAGPGGAWWHRSCSGVYINAPDIAFGAITKPPGKSSYGNMLFTYSRLTLI